MTPKQAFLAARLAKPKRPSRPFSFNHQTYTHLTDHWKALSLAQRTAYVGLGQRMTGPKSARPLTGYQAFMSLNTGRQTLKLAPLQDPPPAPDAVPYLSNLTVTAIGPTRNEPQPGPFRLSLHADPIDTPLQVFIAPPTYPQETPPHASKFLALGVIDGIGPEGADITALYQRKYCGYEQGYMIAVRLVPHSPSGFRGQAVTALGTVGAPP